MSGFGAFLLENRLIKQSELSEALERQLASLMPLGRLAVEEGSLSGEQVRVLRERQREEDRLLGDLALDRAWISREELERLIELQQSRRRRLGRILVDMRCLGEATMQGALAEYEAISDLKQHAIREVLDEMPRGWLIEKLIDFAGRHLERATGEAFTLALLDVDTRCRNLMGIEGSQAIVQTLTGTGGLSFALLLDQDWMEFIASKMLEFSGPPDEEMVEDTVCELVNLIAGNALSALGSEAAGLHSEPPEIRSISDLNPGKGGCVFLEYLGPRGAVLGLIMIGNGVESETGEPSGEKLG